MEYANFEKGGALRAEDLNVLVERVRALQGRVGECGTVRQRPRRRIGGRRIGWELMVRNGVIFVRYGQFFCEASSRGFYELAGKEWNEVGPFKEGMIWLDFVAGVVEQTAWDEGAVETRHRRLLGWVKNVGTAQAPVYECVQVLRGMVNERMPRHMLGLADAKAWAKADAAARAGMWRECNGGLIMRDAGDVTGQDYVYEDEEGNERKGYATRVSFGWHVKPGVLELPAEAGGARLVTMMSFAAGEHRET